MNSLKSRAWLYALMFSVLLAGVGLLSVMTSSVAQAQSGRPTIVFCLNLQGPRANRGPEPYAFYVTDQNGSPLSSIQTPNGTIDLDNIGDFTQTRPFNSGGCTWGFDFTSTDSFDTRNFFYFRGKDTLTLKIPASDFADNSRYCYRSNSGIKVCDFRRNSAYVLIEGDANSDNKISGSDSSIFASHYNAITPYCVGDSKYNTRADFNEDGCIDDSDFSILTSNMTFPWKTGDLIPVPTGNPPL